MKTKNPFLPLLVILAFTSVDGWAKKEVKNPNLKLWYNTPADATVRDIPWDAGNPTASTYAIDKEFRNEIKNIKEKGITSYIGKT